MAQKSPNKDESDEDSNSDNEQNGHSATTRQRRLATRGMAFLLQQIRQSTDTTNPITRPDDKTSTKGSTTKKIKLNQGINCTMSDKPIVHEQLPLTSDKASKHKIIRDDLFLPSDENFYKTLVPLQVISDCFKQGTTPDFGPHIRQLIGENNYLRCCKWSPDGNWLLTESVDRLVRIFKFDGQQAQFHQKILFGGLIYDLLWSPNNNEQPHFITTARGQPIQCWTLDGQLLTTFSGINDSDELDTAYSICYSNNGQYIYAGYKNRLRLFDFERGAGRQVREIKTYQKGTMTTQKGIVSTMAMCPTFDGVFAVATFTGSLGLYSMQTGGCDCLIGTNNGPGITHLQYSLDGNRIFVGLRKNPSILCYDLRMPVQQLASFKRQAYTNQRFYFQLDSYDRYLYSGSSDGKMLIYDLKKSSNQDQEQEHQTIEPTHAVRCSAAAVTGLSLHPHHQLVAICTGQRVFPDWLLSEQLFRNDNEIMAAAAATPEMGTSTTTVIGAQKIVDDDDDDKVEEGKECERNYVEFGRGSPFDNTVKLYKLQI